MRSISLYKRLAVAVSAVGFIAAAGSASAQEQTIRVGTVSGPDAEVWQVVQKVAKKNGLNVKVVEFNDYVQPNAALDAGDLDANSFQHQPTSTARSSSAATRW